MLVVTNERAGRTEAAAVAEVIAELGGPTVAELVTCHRDADLEAMLDRRAGRPVVVIGGDGSLHTMLRHLWRRGEAADCAVGLIPLGTGNDFARGVGIPLDHREAARLVRDGKPCPVDLIVDDTDGVVVNAVHVGAGAEAAMRARPLKRRLRQVAFPVGAVAAGFSVRGWRLRVEVDGAVVTSGRRRVLMAGLSNAPTIAGGTAELGPGASPTDGWAEVTVSLATGWLARIGYALALVRGRHPDRSDVIHLSGTTVTISGSPFHTNADGELSGPVRRRTWRVVPGAWRCILP
ncbi:diacylglycerol/lipid kinase family protein [Planosporangium sp. 12N6]|uniref:diacylglycerol/lipid kinase family protein n=1 Tax=Planosporangium spinosum TaxID=3402278 RepID=UPI003CE73A4C